VQHISCKSYQTNQVLKEGLLTLESIGTSLPINTHQTNNVNNLFFGIFKFSLKIKFINFFCTIHNHGFIYIINSYLILDKYEDIICIKLNNNIIP